MKSRLILLVVMVAVLASNVGAQCYPPGSRVVIFMQGVYSSLDAEGTDDIGWEDHAFDKLKASFVSAGYNESQLLDFSYRGGAISEQGAWTPNIYACSDTDRVSDANLAVLEKMLRDYRAKHPDAHFTLVGHSLGGYLAYLEAVRESARPDGDRLHVDVVIALQAPLNGVSADKKLALDAAVSCPKTYNAAAEIVADKLNPDIGSLRASQVAAMKAAGTRLATLGNNGDCLYNLSNCLAAASIVDDTQTQYIDSADLVKRYHIESHTPISHFAVIAYPQALLDIIAFVGPP
jgi:pimeloyl-ACP methyl ester carboxylesterase